MARTPEEELARYKRRHDRNMRVAEAHGFLKGVCAMLQPGDLAIDCGANVGEVTQHLAATGADVQCFEPDPYAFGKLKKRFGDAPNVTLFNAAAGTTAGTVSLHRAPNFDERPKGASVKSTILDGGRGVSKDDADSVEVELLDFMAHLDREIDNRGEIAFLKMDIEGAELEILEAMEKKGTFEAVRCTVAETHENKFPDLADRFAALRDTISNTYPKARVNLDWI